MNKEAQILEGGTFPSAVRLLKPQSEPFRSTEESSQGRLPGGGGVYGRWRVGVSRGKHVPAMKLQAFCEQHHHCWVQDS